MFLQSSGLVPEPQPSIFTPVNKSALTHPISQMTYQVGHGYPPL